MLDHDSLFTQDGDRFVPTSAAGNPWGEFTGGGPIAGLVARAVETAVDDPDLLVTRLTVDLVRPVPRTPLEVTVEPLRTGKRLHVVDVTLRTGGRAVTRATAQLLRRSEVDGPEGGAPADFPGPEGIADGHLLPPELELLPGVHDIVQVRWVADQSTSGPSRAWMRMPLPLLPDEPLSPLSHVAVLVDCISAAAPVSPIFGPWINTDITLYLHRALRGEWLGVEIRRDVQPSGIGVARALLYDEHGAIGTAHEAVMVNQLG
ncbi:thioesterase family protein [Saccharopolyspora rectivirgula]|uniref:thioesterase family protein n=1 Tax=Saccharopolyspora rectivirgula TaxID=28042 RepID=UPI00240943D8|nr:thioesterase family protein [Saccharopolyspora rectivirgula]